ncbi:hypothetical protein EVJ58_g1655 [Rhodofomes roseus]|uniref:Uncharacterized protein n=1 Tax=Rhodofomes roseus TaxID=34475 RepID=A0A4Y9Z047_9APHY|nr:hypothetical protein EVJ58_g1655 [Rhodofomes roseus]
MVSLHALTHTQAPSNRPSAEEHHHTFEQLIEHESAAGRFVGPFSQSELERLVGPFQSSPISIIAKPAKPGHFRIIQNFSFPHTPSTLHPNSSINSFIDSDNFPCTWGTFATISLLIWRLPPGSQAAVRDVAEAYRTIPLHPSQWPAGVVRAGPNALHVDTCLAFGASPSAGGYGVIADAGADLIRANGMGPVNKWVDDHFFVRILLEHLSEFNRLRALWSADLVARGKHQTGGRIWYGGSHLDDGTLDQFDEDCVFPLLDLSAASPRSSKDGAYTYCMADIDALSRTLGIPWEASKDSDFAQTQIFTGLRWDLQARTVGLPEKKAAKYLAAIHEWQTQPHHTYTLHDVQRLYGKLLHSSLVVPRGRAYLTGLEAMLRVCADRPFVPHSPVRSISADLRWWVGILQQPRLHRPIPQPTRLIDLAAFSDASSGIGIAITVGDHWRAWRLIPGWRTSGGERDIGWAEAVGFQLLTLSITSARGAGAHYRLFGDNSGVVEGWHNRRSKNPAVNLVFQQLLQHLHSTGNSECIHTAYVPSAHNPADGPSRGIYPSRALLLPPVPLPPGLDKFLVDSQEPLTPLELRLHREGRYPPAAAKFIDRALEHDRAAQQRDIDDALDWHICTNGIWDED